MKQRLIDYIQESDDNNTSPDGLSREERQRRARMTDSQLKREMDIKRIQSKRGAKTPEDTQIERLRTQIEAIQKKKSDARKRLGESNTPSNGLTPDTCEVVYVEEGAEDIFLSEAAVRQFKRIGKKIVRRYRCLSGPKAGKIVSSASACAQRKDPKKVRHGRKIMRSQKAVIKRKSKITKGTALSRLVSKLNKDINSRKK